MGGGHKLQIDDVFLGGGHSKVDMGRYEGGRGLKWPKIGDVVYGWPHICFTRGNFFVTSYILLS